MSPTPMAERSAGELVARAVDSFSELVQIHLDLAKAELVDDTRRLGKALVPLFVGVPLILLGYVLLCFAAAAALAPLIGAALALVVLAALHLGVGLAAARVTVIRLRKVEPVASTLSAELARTVRELVPQPPVEDATEVSDVH
jgi:uncharacterized membrane protein YqjE